MRHLLDQMVAEGWVSPEAAEAAWREPIAPRGWRVRYDEEGNLLEAELVDPEARILRQLDYRMAPISSWRCAASSRPASAGRRSMGRGLRVYTTLDPAMQRAAEAAARNARLPDGAELALVGLDPETGEVLALVGGCGGRG